MWTLASHGNRLVTSEGSLICSPTKRIFYWLSTKAYGFVLSNYFQKRNETLCNFLWNISYNHNWSKNRKKILLYNKLFRQPPNAKHFVWSRIYFQLQSIYCVLHQTGVKRICLIRMTARAEHSHPWTSILNKNILGSSDLSKNVH